jgi:predicted CoA-substrate-specific enzyme activase
MNTNGTDFGKAIGICLGATSFTLAEVKRNSDGSITVTNAIAESHEGDPKGIVKKRLEAMDFSETYLGATGRKYRNMLNIPSIIEPEATERAYAFVNCDRTGYDAVVSAGGETFMVYEIDKKGRISRISSGNKCASGTGEFFMQQIGRMNVSIEEAIRLSRTSKTPHELSGRCSVFCKSDCTHALNKGESIADVAAGLARMIAGKIEELLVKINARKVMIVGGTARNDVVIGFLEEAFDLVTVPAEAAYFEALGAALWALETRQVAAISSDGFFRETASSFTFLKPIRNFESNVEFKSMPYGRPVQGDRCVIGLDVGSTTTKAVLLRLSDEKILKSVYLRTSGNPVKASRECYASLHRQLGDVTPDIIGLGVTGSGRYIAALHADTGGVINEIIAHARAAAHFDPEVDTIYEIGGQDAKYTYLTNLVASDYAMNEACSAGTGSFLEESAYESLGVKMEDIAGIALAAQNPPNFSDQCAAFISSDINTALQEGIGREDIVAGLVYSICINYVNRVKGSRQTGRKVFMQGGVCYNRAIPMAMAALTGKKIIVPPEPGLMGAYGVALECVRMIELGLIPRQSFDLADLADREVEYGKSFVCQGMPENCDRKCPISMIHVAGKKVAFGGACNKYYNLAHKIKVDVKLLNHVETRQELMFSKAVLPSKAKSAAPVIGLNRSFHTNTLYPFYYTFFNELGCKVVMPDTVEQSGIDKGMTSYCLAGKISLGMFENLLLKKPDYVFLPHIKEMHVSEEKEYRIEFQTTCMFVQGEPWYLRATFLRDNPNPPKLIAPVLNFMAGYDAEEKQFVRIAQQLGFSAEEGRRAHGAAFRTLMDYFKAMKAEGRRIMAELEKDPNKVAIVLFGRPYNAFADEANKGVPYKFASRGYEIIPYDFLPFEEEPNFRDTYWEMGQKIIKAAQIIKRHPQLFGCYLTNFLCALDSMMLTHFRDLMATKPSLTIEVDTHTADAGVNTRVEAFLDVIKNYLKVKESIRDLELGFHPAKLEVTQTGKVTIIDSDLRRFPVKDPKVKVVVPSMGNFFAEGIAAALRAIGWPAEPLPVCDREALDLARAVMTSKECLPIIVIVGQLLKYLKYRKDPDEKLILMNVGSGGCCRVGQYAIMIDMIIEKLRIRDVTQCILTNDNGYAGLGIGFRLNAVKAMYAGDILDDIRSAIKAHAADRAAALKTFGEEVTKVWASIDRSSAIPFFAQLRKTAEVFRRIPLQRPFTNPKYVGVVGEIFVRRDHFSLMGIPEKLAGHGFVMLDAPVSEWVRYTDFLRDIEMLTEKRNFIGKVEYLISDIVQDHYEKNVKKIFMKSGLYDMDLINIRKYMAHSTHFFPLELTGEPGLSTGAALHHYIDKYCGTIAVGPFGCMNSRMAEAVATVEMTIDGKEKAVANAGHPKDYSDVKEHIDMLPFLCLELDGNPFSQIDESRLETFMMQAGRLHEVMVRRSGGNGKTHGAKRLN